MLGAIIVCAMLMLCVYSCNSGEESKNETPPKDGDFEYDGGMWRSIQYKIEERTIDSCQYIIIFGLESRNIIHKANCRNSGHVCP